MDLVYTGVISSQREAIETTGELDPVTQDMLITQCAQLELFQWFMRAHLEDPSGVLETVGAETEKTAAKKTK